MNEQCTKIRYAYSVIDVARTLHETAIGSADLGHSKEELDQMADWLQWRVSDAEWRAPISAYDNSVRTLAKLAIEAARRARCAERSQNECPNWKGNAKLLADVLGSMEAREAIRGMRVGNKGTMPRLSFSGFADGLYENIVCGTKTYTVKLLPAAAHIIRTI